MTAGFTVLGQNIDPDPSNAISPVTVDVAAATDLSVAIAPGSAAVAQIDWTYTVDVTNPGPSPATGRHRDLPLPADVTFVSASSSKGIAPTEQDGIITADLGTIASGGSATLTIVIDPSSALAGGTIPLAATVAGNQYDPNPANNQASLNLVVPPSST